MVVTGSSAYVIRNYEASFESTITNDSAMVFGFDQKLSGLEWMNNQTALGQIYTPELEAFLYGRDAGGLSIEYTMGNSYWLTSLLNNPVTEDDNGGAGPITRTWSSDPDDAALALNSTRVAKTQNLEIGFALIENTTTSNPQVRRATGAVTQNLNLKTSIDNPVAITETIIWGNEDAVGSTLNSGVPSNSGFAPMNFVNSNVQLNYGTGLESLVKVQDLDFTLNRNQELLYELNDSGASDAYTKVIEMTGKVMLAFDNIDAYQAVADRAELTSMSITITNGQSGTDERSLTMTFGGVGLSRHGNPDIQPGEPIFQEFDYQCRTVSAVAVDNTAIFNWT